MAVNDLVESENLSPRLISLKSSEYLFRSAKPTEKEILEQEGWELVIPKSKKLDV
jgi:hypothetical protein